MNNNSILKQKYRLLNLMPRIVNYTDEFRKINQRWRFAITSGKIETGQMKKDAAKLFGPLTEDMGTTITKYEEIQKELVNTILVEMVNKVAFEISDAAKFTINILKRNLFERTADVGYLSTDGEIINFLKAAMAEDDHANLSQRAEAIRERLMEYQQEYTVYNEIIITDTNKQIVANLDTENLISRSTDSLLDKTMEMDLQNNLEEDKYIETFRKTDLLPGRENVLVYSQKIEDPDSKIPLGVLCLCFEFEEEMKGIFKDLSLGNENIIAGILDAKGRVVSTNQQDTLPLSTHILVNTDSQFDYYFLNGEEYLISTVLSDGYQGFYGLPWYGFAMINMKTVFADNPSEVKYDTKVIGQVQNFSKELSAIKRKSDDLLFNMKIDGLNGEIQAAKFMAKAFVEIINYVKIIGQDTDNLFASAIRDLQQTIVTSLFNDVQFRAFQGNNISDRNLYERANDVCWWALTPLFRRLLSKHQDRSLADEDLRDITKNLQYINDLYTPYLRLILVDMQGRIVATSNPPDELEESFLQEGHPRGQEFVGMEINNDTFNAAINLPSSKDYCVSKFCPTPLYGGRHTYMYNTAVRDIEDMNRVVGVLQIVFDAEPQFKAMLTDVLPKNENKKIVEGSFGIFSERNKKIISTTSPDYPVGTEMLLEKQFFEYPNGARDAAIVELGSQSYAMGLQVSDGYREFKSRDGYSNDVVCMIFVPI